MKLGDPTPKPLPSEPSRDIENANEKARQKVENFVRTRVSALLEHATKESDKKHFAINQITTLGRRIFRDRENLLDTALEKIEAGSYATDQELEEALVRELTGAVLLFLTESGFSEQEAKIYFRSIMQESLGFTPLDKDGVLSFSRYEDKIDLHITEGFTIEIFQRDMSNLAQIVINDESIKTIKMTSWVVAKYPNAVRRFGFTIAESLSESVLEEIRANLPPEMRDKPIAEAYMTREEFIKRFSK